MELWPIQRGIISPIDEHRRYRSGVVDQLRLGADRNPLWSDKYKNPTAYHQSREWKWREMMRDEEASI